MRLLFFGDGKSATLSLQRLAQEERTLLGVIACPHPEDPRLLDLARELELPVFQPQNVNDIEFVNEVASLNPSLNLSVFYDQIFRRPLLETASLGSVNFHPGKLPCYRGRCAINWAMINGENEIGLTAHYMDTKIDTGDIILQRTVPVHWTDTFIDVLQKVERIVPGLVAETVDLIEDNRVQPLCQPQSAATYFSYLEYQDQWIDWSDTSLNIYNRIRAVAQLEPQVKGAKTYLSDQVVTIWHASYDLSWPRYKGAPGQVVELRPKEGVIVKTGDSNLLIREIQIGSNKNQIPTWRVGTRLGLNLSFYLMQQMAKVAGLEKDFQQFSEGT